MHKTTTIKTFSKNIPDLITYYCSGCGREGKWISIETNLISLAITSVNLLLYKLADFFLAKFSQGSVQI